MNTKKTTENCFGLLQRIISSAFSTEVLYFSPPYENLSEIDQGLRDILLPGFSAFDSRLTPSHEHPERRFFVVKSNLGFYNIIIYLNLKKKPDFFSIGPFRAEEFTSDYFPNIVKNTAIPKDSYAVLKKYYCEIPYLSLSSIVSICKEIVSVYYTEFTDIKPIHIEYTNTQQILQIDTQILNDIFADFAEEYQKTLFQFLEFLAKGLVDPATSALSDFLKASRFIYIQNLEEARRELHILNGYCRTACLGTTVHPSYVLQLSSNMVARIESASNRSTLHRIANDLCHKYCLLIKNYAFHDYSKLIRAVINYIHLHLDEDLSLSRIAEQFHKNASSLSSAFSKEVGMSITNYIHQTRIKEAILYFNTTNMSVSEVAVAVGFQDFAYFSRLFHKQIGCSPRDYCKNIHQN